MSKIKIAVVGASSMVGSRFCELSGKNFDLVKADLNGGIAVDITDKKSVDDFFKNHKFDILLLFSAYTDVDGAEKQRNDKDGICWKINVDGVKNMVDVCRKFRRELIFISTDFVFDGTKGPYSEEDLTGPDKSKLSWYGITKVEAESYIKEFLSDFLIIRISYPYRARFEGKDDITKRMLRLYREDKLYPLFIDQTITPTFIDDIAGAIGLLIDKRQSGIFHLASPKISTQFEFGREVIKIFGGDPKKIEKSSVVDFLKRPTSTPRPIKGGFKVDKIRSLGFSPTDWKEGVKKIYEQSKGKLI